MNSNRIPPGRRPRRRPRCSLAASRCAPQATVGQPAPAFSAPDQTGATRSLDAYKGKCVVLEWVNHECPFVKKHYGSGNMQKLQKATAGQGRRLALGQLVGPRQAGRHGRQAGRRRSRRRSTRQPTAVLLDPEGTVGRAYGAKTTPHMFVIDPKGTLVYAGAIDDKPVTDPADVPKREELRAGGLDEAMAGKPVTVASDPAVRLQRQVLMHTRDGGLPSGPAIACE